MPAFPSGTRKFFKNTTAPTGWVKDATTYDHTLRIVTTSALGSGGTIDFSSMFSSTRDVGGLTYPGVAATATVGSAAMDIPAHSHTFSGSTGTPVNVLDGGYYYPAGATTPPTITGWYGAPSARTSGSTGVTTGHTHTISSTVAVSFGSSTADMSVKYVDSIICTKS